MKKIGLLSDTHSHIEDEYLTFFKDTDEIWHAGDIGSTEVYDKLKNFKPVRAVYGNIDNHNIRAFIPEHQKFEIDGLRVWMTHIGGYPGKYSTQVKHEIYKNPPDLFISGHSHILKVMPDKNLNLLHINPGAAGKRGLHKVRTLVRFEISNSTVKNLEIWEKER